MLDMKYLCKGCKIECDDIIEHIKKEHGFSESYIKDSLKTNSNSYKNSFEKIKRDKNHFKIEPFEEGCIG